MIYFSTSNLAPGQASGTTTLDGGMYLFVVRRDQGAVDLASGAALINSLTVTSLQAQQADGSWLTIATVAETANGQGSVYAQVPAPSATLRFLGGDGSVTWAGVQDPGYER